MGRTSHTSMSVRFLSLLAFVTAGSVLISACQPTVGVSRAMNADRLNLAQPEAPIVPVRPSARVGGEVFKKTQCVVCHGPEGLGNGPAAGSLKSSGENLLTDFLKLLGINIRGEQLPSRPANFHNTVQMRLNSPFSMYETVTRGRPHTAMPSFGPRPAYGASTFGVRLTDEERWHVIFFEFAFATTPAEVAKGKQLYDTLQVQVPFNGVAQPLTCASCHGTAGDGRGPLGAELSRKLWGWARGQGPGIFTDINLMAQRKPTELFQAILDGRGEMPGYRGKLTEEQVWALVNYIWTFVYDYSGKP